MRALFLLLAISFCGCLAQENKQLPNTEDNNGIEFEIEVEDHEPEEDHRPIGKAIGRMLKEKLKFEIFEDLLED